MRQSEAIRVEGPAGLLEARVDRSEPATTRAAGAAPLALLCHPHPQFGGSMEDAVLASIAEVLLARGYVVVRFNFRGVGASSGNYAGGIGEADDVRAMLDALQHHPAITSAAQPAAGILLVGYSFGAAMAWAAATQTVATQPPLLSGLWLVAPPLSVMTLEPDSSALQPALCMIVGSVDDYCSVADAQQWLASMAVEPAAALTVVTGADHFFGGLQAELRAAAAAYLDAISPHG